MYQPNKTLYTRKDVTLNGIIGTVIKSLTLKPICYDPINR